MPTADDDHRLSPSDVESVVAAVCFPDRDDEREPGRVGLEIERFPVRVDSSGRPRGRLLLDRPLLDHLESLDDGGHHDPPDLPDAPDPPDALSVCDGLVGAGRPVLGRSDSAGVPSYLLTTGGRITFEPGGAVEHATAAHDTASRALDEVRRLSPDLAATFHEAGIALASTGVDPWTDAGTVPLQITNFRYRAMADYFERRGVEGRVIMRNSSSIQVNLDLGPIGHRRDRWLLANLLAPVVTATFANSPVPDGVSGRALAWQGLDPTRTGFPARLLDPSVDDPVVQMTSAALEADVLLVRTADDGARPGQPGWTFADWLRDGHPDHGRPTVGDLVYHLSTIFHEVRPRGMLEFRGIDALPQRWRSVPVALLTGAIEEASSRERLLDLLEGRRPELPSLWRRAAREGVADPAFCALAVEVWSFAFQGARRLPPGYLSEQAVADAEAFLETFTLRGRCPADDLRAHLREGPAAALAWASEPVPEPAGRAR